MALYTTFGKLQTMLRAEARLSTNPAVNASSNERLKGILNRTYSTLYLKHDWSHLRYQPAGAYLMAGQRYYDLPAGIDYNRIEQIVAWIGNVPYPLDPGIGFDEYAAYNSDIGMRVDPPQRYDFRANSAGSIQMEIWPIPASSDTYKLQVIGTRAAPALVNSGDICLLDDNLVVLRSAAAIMQSTNPAEAKEKLLAFQDLYDQLTSHSTLAQTAGESAPALGVGTPRATLRNGHAVISIARSK